MIRRARIEDLPQMLEIYNYEILHGVATFDEKEKTYEERKEWFEHFQGKYPLIVEEENGRIKGYAGAYKLFQKPAYDISAEVTLYISQEYRGQGIGEKLLRELVRVIEDEGQIEQLFSLITSTNLASKKLHEKVGFKFDGIFKKSGKKFGERLSVDIYRYETVK